MLVGLLTAAALVALSAQCMHESRAQRRRRGTLFADSLSLLEAYRVTQEGGRFPVLEGRYKGLRVKLEPVLDDIGVRKIPSLWLKATVLVSNPDRGVLDLLVRPQGVELYSPSHDLERRLPIPDGWPKHAILCTDTAGATPDLARLTPHIRAFDDPRMKELLVTPRGIRLVYQASQARRSDYLVLRKARFDARLDPRLVAALLDRATAVAAALDAEPLRKAA